VSNSEENRKEVTKKAKVDDFKESQASRILPISLQSENPLANTDRTNTDNVDNVDSQDNTDSN
jgi:hypothetical protein